MKKLQDKILQEGKVLPGGILKVDSFLNHQVDPFFLEEMAAEFHRLFAEDSITKVLTIEASGIAIAAFTAKAFGVPMVYAKKAGARNISEDTYRAEVHSFTYDVTYPVTVAKEYLSPDDRLLIIDDFLANGQAIRGMISIARQAGAEVAGIGVCIEKVAQHGGEGLRDKFHVESLATIEQMDENGIVFKEAE